LSTPKKKPGVLWLLFYGRRRRGFPWLLAGVVLTLVVLGLTFAIPGGVDVWRSIAPALFGVLIVGALLAAVVAALRPRNRR
jgi:hypothetical protein